MLTLNIQDFTLYSTCGWCEGLGLLASSAGGFLGLDSGDVFMGEVRGDVAICGDVAVLRGEDRGEEWLLWTLPSDVTLPARFVTGLRVEL